MKQGIQANFPHEQIRKYGCYFLCLCKWAELATGKELTGESIIAMYHRLVRYGFMEHDCFMVNPVSALNELCGKPLARTVYKTTQTPANTDTFMIYQKKPDHEHFVLYCKGEIWDSLEPNRPGVKDYTVDSYRVIA